MRYKKNVNSFVLAKVLFFNKQLSERENLDIKFEYSHKFGGRGGRGRGDKIFFSLGLT